MNKLMYRFVTTRKKKKKKKKEIDPFLDTVCPFRASRVKKEKKEIDPFLDTVCPFRASRVIIDHSRSHIKHSKVCFIRYPNTSKSFEKTRLRLVFSTYFSVFGYLMKHSSSCLIYYEKDCLRLHWRSFPQPKQKSLLGSNKLWSFNRWY